MECLSSTWPRAFMATATVQAVVCLGFEAYTFVKFQQTLGFFVDTDERNLQYRTILTFLTLFIFAFIYELILVWDALRMKNTIQIVGVCVANIALVVYTTLQLEPIEMAIDLLEDTHPPALKSGSVWLDVVPFLVAIPCIVILGTITMMLMTWKLYQEFAWDILKHIGADYRMKKRLLHYHIHIALLKFDFVFFLGFTIQFLVIANDKNKVEFGLTIAAIPATILLLLLAAFFTCQESKFGMVAVIVVYFGGLAYLFFKLVRIYQPSHAQYYIAVRKSLTAFAVLTIVLIIATITNMFICMNNFGTGLKEHLLRRSNMDEESDMDPINLEDVEPQLRSRMSID